MNRAKLHVRMLPIVVLASLLLGLVVGSAQNTSPATSQSYVSITRNEFLEQLRDSHEFEESQYEGGTVTIAETVDIRTLNPLLAYDPLTTSMTNLIFERLVSTSPIDGQAVPQLADFWEVSSDNLVYTFHLNQDAKWHDGSDVSSDDVKFSFDVALSGKLDRVPFFGVDAELGSYRVVDPNTFEMTARDSFATFLDDVVVAVPIMPKHIWEGVPLEAWSSDGGSSGIHPSRVIGSGPFKYESREQNSYVRLMRNANHYAVVPSIDTLILRVVSREDRPSALSTGEADISEGVNPRNFREGIDSGQFIFTLIPTTGMQYYAPNINREMFSNVRVRQALFIALNRDAILSDVLATFGTVALGTQPPLLSHLYAPHRIEDPFQYNPERARTLLQEAGWSDTNGNGIVDKDGLDFNIEILAREESPQTNKLLGAMKQHWQEIGVGLSWNALGSETIQNRVKSGEFDMVLTSHHGQSNGNQGEFFHCSPRGSMNIMGYCNDQYDALDDQQLREFNQERRAELQVQLSNLAWQDVPIGILRFLHVPITYSSRIHNFRPSSFTGRYWNMPYVWVDPPA